MRKLNVIRYKNKFRAIVLVLTQSSVMNPYNKHLCSKGDNVRMISVDMCINIPNFIEISSVYASDGMVTED